MRLQTSVALSFGGNLPNRKGSLDPDNFAIEARRAERERLSLNRRFATVLSGLCAELGRTSEFDAPLFVLPVDDIDLNPVACVPLLELLRSVHSKHLFLIVMADRDLVQTILNLKYQGDLVHLARGAIGPDEQVIVRDLAANALLKHFPAAQQVALTLQEPARALAFMPGPGLPSLELDWVSPSWHRTPLSWARNAWARNA